MELKQLRKTTNEFEEILESALTQKYLHYQPDIRKNLLEINPVRRWQLDKFFDTYISANFYPAERLEKLIYKLFDIKLQFYYILEIDLGLYNHFVYDCGYERSNSLTVPHVFLTRLSFDQSLISKSRILWERIMNFIYFLENSEELEDKVPKKKSKRKVFFDFIRGSSRWRFLEPYEKMLQDYEDSFRTPELHKGSVLRAELLGKRTIDPNKLLELVNRSMVIFWENTLSIIGGGKAKNFTDLNDISEHI